MSLSGAAAQYIEKEYGGAYEEQDGTVSVATTATRIVGSNPDCLALTIINVGANAVYIRPYNNPSTSAGIVLQASGGSVSFTVRDDLTLPGRAWWGIADTAASDVFFVRVNRFSSFKSAVA